MATAVQDAESADRFRRIAGQRVNRALDYIESLRKTADRSRYVFTPEQVALIVSSLREAVDRLETSYTTTAVDERPKVEL